MLAVDGGYVLLVDDLVDIRRSLSRQIEPRYGRVAGAANVREACDWIYGRELIDLAVVDIDLGSEHGSEVMRHLQSERPAVPIIVLSALDDRRIREVAESFQARSARKDSGFEVLAGHIRQAGPARFGAAVAFVAARLSPGEARVFYAYAQGARAGDVLAQLNISMTALQTRRTSIRAKLGTTPDDVLARLRRRYPLVAPTHQAAVTRQPKRASTALRDAPPYSTG